MVRGVVVQADPEEPNPSVPFLPPNANATGLTLVDDVAYVTTSQGCGGVPDGVWALDMTSKTVTSWKATTSTCPDSFDAK